MAIIKAMVGQKVIDGFKGTLDFYYHMGVACVRSWPKSPGKSRSEAVMAQWPVFISATRSWGSVSQSVRSAYEQMAVSTNKRPVDLWVRGYISGVLKFYTPPDALQ